MRATADGGAGKQPQRAQSAQSAQSQNAWRDRRSLRWLVLAVLATASGACRTVEPEPLKLERNLLTVDNRSPHDWNNVEIALNYYYRIRTPKVAAGSRFTATLDTFAAGFGQRFDWRKAQIRDLKLTATLPDGTPLELKKNFDEHGLARALGGNPGGGKR
jgi:hypothetical protein